MDRHIPYCKELTDLIREVLTEPIMIPDQDLSSFENIEDDN